MHICRYQIIIIDIKSYLLIFFNIEEVRIGKFNSFLCLQSTVAIAEIYLKSENKLTNWLHTSSK